MYDNNLLNKNNDEFYNIKDVITIVSGRINNYNQIPMITSSIPIDIEKTYFINSDNTVPEFNSLEDEEYNNDVNNDFFEKEKKSSVFGKLLNILSREENLKELYKYFRGPYLK